MGMQQQLLCKSNFSTVELRDDAIGRTRPTVPLRACACLFVRFVIRYSLFVICKLLLFTMAAAAARYDYRPGGQSLCRGLEPEF